MTYSSLDSFSLSPTTASEIENEISCLLDSKSTGPFGIPTPILKMTKNISSDELGISCGVPQGSVLGHEISEHT